MKKLIRRIVILMLLTFLLNSCRNNENCFLFRKWKILNPLNNSVSFINDTIKTDSIGELKIKKCFIDSLTIKNINILLDTTFYLNNNHIKFESKNIITYKGTNIEIYRVYSYGKSGEILFFYSKEYGTLLKFVNRKTYLLEDIIQSCNPSLILKFSDLTTKILNDSILMPRIKLKFSYP